MVKKGKITIDFGYRKITLENQLGFYPIGNKPVQNINLSHKDLSNYSINEQFKNDPFCGTQLILDYKQNTPYQIVQDDANRLALAAKETMLDQNLEISSQEQNPLENKPFPRIIISSYDCEIAKI